MSTKVEALALLARLRKAGVVLFPYGPDVGFRLPTKADTPEVRDLIHRNREPLHAVLVQERVDLRDRLPGDDSPHGWILRHGKHPLPAMLACGSAIWCDAAMKSVALLQGPVRDLWTRLEHNDVGHIVQNGPDGSWIAPSVKIPGDDRVLIGVQIVSACRLCIVELMWKEPEKEGEE